MKCTHQFSKIVNNKIIFTFATRLKKAATIFLLFLFTAKVLTPAFNLACELEKLPNLFEHFEKHKACTGDSFLKFLSIHFINFSSGDQHQDGESHDNLPFHGNHCEHLTVFYALNINPEIAQSPFKVISITSIYKQEYPLGIPSSPFHPPKV